MSEHSRPRALWLRVTDVFMPRTGMGDATAARRARTAIGVSYAAIVTTLLVALVQLTGFAGFGGSVLSRLFLAFSLAATPVFLGVVTLLRIRGDLGWASVLIQLWVCSFAFTMIYYTGGAASPVTYCLPVVPMGALVTLGPRAAAIRTLMVLAIFGGALGLQAGGFSFANEGTERERQQFWLVCSSTLVLLVFAIAWVFDHARAQALATLEAANRELEVARRAADEANQSQSAFLANMSHEIRTPMMGVVGFAEVALEHAAEEPVSEEDRLGLTTIRQSARNLLEIIDDLLDLSNIEAGRMQVRFSQSRIDAVLAAVGDLLAPQARARGTELAVERAAGVPDVLVTDALRLQQILVNLVGNAIKFSAGGGGRGVRLTVRPLIRDEQEWVRFEVRDSGIGMTREQIEALFKPFAQAEESTARRFGGTGLGLAISGVLAERLGGTIAAESSPGEGSVFSVDLPVDSAALDGGTEVRATREPAGGVVAPAGRPLECRVLVVDDTRDNRRLIKHFLSRAGADVSTASGGEDALRQFEASRADSRPFDVIVMDIQMPGMDGFETRAALRRRGCTAPIVALTAHALASERARCLAAGFSDYASKPIDRAGLVEFVRRSAQGRSGTASAGPDGEAVTKCPSTPTPTPTSSPTSLYASLLHRLTPPRDRDSPIGVRLTRTLLWIALLALPVSALEAWMVAHVWPADVSRGMAAAFLVAPALCGALPLVYRWCGSVSPVAGLTYAALASTFAALTYLSGGAGSAAGAWQAVVPLVAFAVSGVRAALAWLGISLVLNLAFYVAAVYGVSPRDHVAPEMAWLCTGASNVGLTILLVGVAMALERARSETIESLDAANRGLEETRRRTERVTHTKSMFLASVTHELRTPMTAIIGFADLMIERARDPSDLLGPSVLGALYTIRRSGRQLLGVINDLLDFSKVEAGSLRIESLEIDPGQVIVSAIEPLRERAEVRGLLFEVRLDTPIPERITGDPTRIRQILANLCDNALKFTREGHICVSVGVRRGEQGARLCIAVEDTGRGIPADQIPALFTPFHQVDLSSRREQGGSGLGLALCRRLAELMGGRIRVKSEQGAGSRFELELPLRAVARSGLRRQLPRASAVAGSEPRTLGLRLLLAEDGADSQRLIARVLRSAGADVDVVENGRLAIERALASRAGARPYDLILMDIEMPEVGGLEATRILRDAGYGGPILALTAHDLGEERQRCLAEGCDDVASKPVHWPTLFEHIARLCGGTKEFPR